MPDETLPPDRDARLERVLADYLHAAEAGAPPDRAALLAAHPDLAPDIDSFLRNRSAVERVAAPLRDRPPLAETLDGSAAPDGPGPGTAVRYFGDYEILDEIARGGMGVVYRARQVSLNRVVARARSIDGRTLVFGHGHALRALTARWLEQPVEEGRYFRLDTSTLSVLGWERETPVLLRWNS